MSVIDAVPLLAAAGGDYQISRSVRFRSSASSYLTRTPSVASGQNQWTFSTWLKRGAIGSTQYIIGGNTLTSGTVRNILTAEISSDALQVYAFNNGSGYYFQRVSNALYRDPSAWYHIVIQFDPDNATSANRIIAYVNGQQISWGTSSDSGAAGSISSSAYRSINNTYRNDINGGYQGGGAPVYFGDGYQTECNMVSGSIVAASAFGETDVTTGVWKPKKYMGTYGTNGFYLNFSDNSAATAAAIGKDWSGNGNNWTPNNISVTAGVTYDSMLDVPTPYADGGNGRGNYCVINPLTGASTAAVADGNLGVGMNGSEGRKGTIAVTSGKWYWECSFTVGVIDASIVGIANPQDPNIFVISATGYGYYSNANKVNNNTAVAYGAAWGVSDTIGVALDLDAGTLTFYKNGTSQGTAYTGLSGLFCPAFATNASGSTNFRPNFGQRPFAYTPPTGFKALNTQNLPEPTIKKGNQYFDVSLFTGTGSAQTITNSGAMQPDLVWVKGRGEVASHRLVDSVRGVNNVIYSNLTNAETSESGVVTAFNSNGFTGGGANAVTSGYAGVAWQWKESASAGFDIVTYTGTGGGSVRTISHSLGVAPSMIISKCRGTAVLGTDSWVVYFTGFSINNYMFLNSTAAKASSANYLPALPTSSVFSVGGTSANVNNESGLGYVAYLFAEVAGFSKFGSYTGNGSADGPFIYCGFRPKFLMYKRSDSTGSWQLVDSSRSPYNVSSADIIANQSAAEYSALPDLYIDFVANGIKIRSGNADRNASGGTYIFAAFAENPFKNSLAR